jgi:hypothetical protein
MPYLKQISLLPTRRVDVYFLWGNKRDNTIMYYREGEA